MRLAPLTAALLLAAAGPSLAQIGGQLPLPGDSNGPYVAVLCTKACTSAWASGTKPAFDVKMFDGSGAQVGGTTTINFVDGALDVAAIQGLMGPQQVGSPTMLPIAGMYQRQAFVVKWYDQSGSNACAGSPCDAAVVPGDGVAQFPVVRIIGGVAHLGYGNINYDGAVTQPRLKLPDQVAIGTRAVTVAAVTSRWKSNSDFDKNALFYTANDGTSGVGIIGASEFSSDLSDSKSTSWRTLLLGTTDGAVVPIHADQQVLTLASGAAAGEIANDLGIASFAPPAAATGTGFVVGSLSTGINEYSGAQGNIDAVLVKGSYSAPAVTADIRAKLGAYYGIAPPSAPNIVLDGDSGTFGYGTLYPAINNSLQGSQGFAPTQQIPLGLKRASRINNIARGNSNFASGTGNSIVDRAPRVRAMYNPSASVNMASAVTGALPPSGTAAINAQVASVVAWVTALRSTGQAWSVFVGDQSYTANPCAATADGDAYRAALVAAGAANNFTVVGNYNQNTFAACFDALYTHGNLWAPAPVSHVEGFGLGFNLVDQVAKMNAVLP